MYYRQGNDPRYTPFLYKIANYLGTAAAEFGMGIHYVLFSVIRCVLEDRTASFLSSGLCSLAIITMNFCNTMHIDAGDEMAQWIYNEVITRLESMSPSYAQESLNFLKWSKSVAVATTCVYQHIFGDGKDEGEEIIAYFPMLACVSLRLKPWLVHHFFASKISHW